MDRADRLSGVAMALLEAGPNEIHLVARDHLRAIFGTRDAELYLADYRQAHLHRVTEPDPGGTPVDATPLGRAFLQQTLVVHDVPTGVEVCAPVSVRGDCLGVLAATWANPPELAVQQDLEALATMLGHAMVVAETASDRYRRLRRRQRMTLPAEIQWDLLPGRGLDAEQFRLAGQLEPAYSVKGDNFDWSADDEHLTVTMTNGMGEGSAAALLTSLGINALRNGRRAGLPPADQAALADNAIWAQFDGRSHLSTLLLRIELATGKVVAVDAGSPRMFLLRGDGREQVVLDQQLPLGMFGDSTYLEQDFVLHQGDRLLLLSDGVVDAVTDGGSYGEIALDRVLRGCRLLSPAGAVRLLVSDLMVFHAGRELSDDAVAVCLDWTGKDGG